MHMSDNVSLPQVWHCRTNIWHNQQPSQYQCLWCGAGHFTHSKGPKIWIFMHMGDKMSLPTATLQVHYSKQATAVTKSVPVCRSEHFKQSIALTTQWSYDRKCADGKTWKCLLKQCFGNSFLLMFFITWASSYPLLGCTRSQSKWWAAISSIKPWWNFLTN